MTLREGPQQEAPLTAASWKRLLRVRKS